MLQIVKPEAYQFYRIRDKLYITKTSPNPFKKEGYKVQKQKGSCAW